MQTFDHVNGDRIPYFYYLVLQEHFCSEALNHSRPAVGSLFFALSLLPVNLRHPLSITNPYFSLSFGKCRTIKPLFSLSTGCRSIKLSKDYLEYGITKPKENACLHDQPMKKPSRQALSGIKWHIPLGWGVWRSSPAV